MLGKILKPFKPLLIRLLIETEKTEKKITPFKEPKKFYISPAILLALDFGLIYYILILYLGREALTLLATFLLLFLFSAVIIFHLYTNHKKILSDKECSTLITFLIFVYVSLLVITGVLMGINPYLFPIASLSILLMLLISEPNVSIIVTFIPIILLTLLSDARAFIFHILSSITAIYLTPRVIHREDVLKIGAIISFLNFILVLICDAIFIKTFSIHNVIYSILNGVISALIALALLTPLENIFSRLTNIKLVELADFNQPLLKRLMFEAPGTYHHSLVTASIAEKVARAVKADPLLTRVAAYYHDIGKLIRPEYFAENQTGIENPHDTLPTTMSSLIILSHVKEGVKLAKEQGLNDTIIEIIQQHHGTSKIHSLDVKKDEDVRYPGPKPMTNESAVLMLADACEAAVREFKSPTPQKIKETVLEVINTKLMDGQFENAPLTLSDLYSVADLISNTLVAVHHVRS